MQKPSSFGLAFLVRPNRRAFTMLELIAVLVVMGLVSAIAMVSVIGHLEQSELTRISQQIANADRKERDASRQSPFPGRLTIERLKKRLHFKNSDRTIELGRNVKVSEVIVISPAINKEAILFSQSGQSPTYAIRLESPRGAMKWVLVVGMTGQIQFSDSTEDVRSLLAMGG